MSTLVIPSGRLYNSLKDKLSEYNVILPFEHERKYFNADFFGKGQNLFIAKPKSIANLVGNNHVDFGICGEDIIYNSEFINELEIIKDFSLHQVKICLCSRLSKEELFKLNRPIVVATEYELIAHNYFMKNRHPYYVLQTFGGTEGYVDLMGVDCIIDIVESGNTLRKNDIHMLEEIITSSTVLFKRKDNNKTFQLFNV